MTQKIMWLHSHITNVSGSSKFLYNILKQLSTKYEITLFVQKPILVNDDFEKLPIKIVVMSNCSTSDLKFWFNFSSEIKKQKYMLKKISPNFDLVISSFFPMNVIANSLNIPHLQLCFQPYAFFWDFEMIKSLAFHKMFLLLLLKLRYSKLDYNTTRNSRKILTINEGSRKSIFEVYGMDSIPTFMGIDVYNKIDLAKTGIQRDKKIVLHSTDWSPSKRTFWLIEQFKKINNEYDNVELLITETKFEPKLKSKAVEFINKNSIKNIKFLGMLESNVLIQYMQSANLVVYPGFAKGITTSLFVLECMAYKVPPIIHKEVSEDVEHGKTGYVFSTDSEFQKYVLTLLNEPQLENKLGFQAQQYVLNKFNWKKVREIFETHIEELIK